MGCCIHCRSNVTDKDRRTTVPEVIVAEKDRAEMHALEYFTCPSCKKEWSEGFTYEVITTDGTALKACQEGMRQCGFTREWKS